MKKVYQLIATATLSLMTVGAIAQVAGQASVSKPVRHAVSSHFARPAKKSTANTTYAFLDYPLSDSALSSAFGNSYLGSPSVGGFYIQELNMHYVTKDTGMDGANGQPVNDALLRYVSVGFDTILDAASGMGYAPSQVSSFVVDSLIIPIGQENLSGKADSIEVQINSLGAYGIPTATKLWDTIIVTTTGLSGSTPTSWFNGYNLMFAPHLAVASGKFGVTLKYYDESKIDTFGFLYGSPSYNCAAAGGAYPDTTYIGTVIPFTSPAGKVRANSFSNGWEYFYGSPTFTGTPLSLPNTKYGAFLQYGCGTAASIGLDWQDIAMYAEVSFVVTGVNEVSANGLDVAQNFPNPFNKATQINYTVTKSSDVVFNVYDLTGRKIMGNTYSEVAPGQHVINISANQFTPGVYFYTFNVNGKSVTKRMVITE
jgi:hypothetical protein